MVVCVGVMIKRVKRGSGNRSLPHDCADIFIASILLVDTQQALPSPTPWTDQDSLLETLGDVIATQCNMEPAGSEEHEQHSGSWQGLGWKEIWKLGACR